MLKRQGTAQNTTTGPAPSPDYKSQECSNQSFSCNFFWGHQAWIQAESWSTVWWRAVKNTMERPITWSIPKSWSQDWPLLPSHWQELQFSWCLSENLGPHLCKEAARLSLPILLTVWSVPWVCHSISTSTFTTPLSQTPTPRRIWGNTSSYWVMLQSKWPRVVKQWQSNLSPHGTYFPSVKFISVIMKGVCESGTIMLSIAPQMKSAFKEKLFCN